MRKHACRLFFLLALGLQNEKRHVSCEHDEENQSFPPDEGVAPKPERDQERARTDEHRKIEKERAFLHGEPAHESGKSQNEQNVRDVAPDDVSDGNIRRMFDRRRHRNGEFGRARSERDDGEPDDERGNFQFARDARAPVHQPVRALYKKGEPDDEKKDL